MPRFFVSQLNTSVRQSIAASHRDLLPEAIRESQATSWILRYDELSSPLLGEDEFVPRTVRGSYDYLNRAVQRLIGASLRKEVSFYYFSLFFIGRQWKVSELAERDLLSCSKPGWDEQDSVFLPKDLLDKTGDRAHLLQKASTKDFRAAIKLLFQTAQDHHRASVAQAQAHWATWQSEVEDLQARVGRARDLLVRTRGRDDRDESADAVTEAASLFVVPVSLSSSLYRELQRSGVIWRNGDQSEEDAGGFAPLLSAVIMSRIGSERMEYSLRHLEHLEHERLRLQETAIEEERQRRLTPLVQVSLRLLEEKYGKGNPFERFMPLKMAPEPLLDELVLENRLPGGSNSPWLESWLARLGSGTRWSERILLSNLVPTQDEIRSFALAADCAVKRAIKADRVCSGESWDAYLQRLFEKHWVSELAYNVVKPLRDKKEGDKSSSRYQSFASLVEKVVSVLNDIGYRLNVPAVGRLAKLWDSRMAGKSYEEW